MIIREVQLRDNKIASLEENVSLLRREIQSRVSPVDVNQPEIADLDLSIGRLFVTDQGVHALFRPPLEKLSDFYIWKDVPFGISATCTLVKGEDESVLGRLSRQLGLSVLELDMLNLESNDSPRTEMAARSRFVDSIRTDTDKLMAWASSLAERCPIVEVSAVLRNLASMNMAEVDRYVETFL